jgi:hypothetical protein
MARFEAQAEFLRKLQPTKNANSCKKIQHCKLLTKNQ